MSTTSYKLEIKGLFSGKNWTPGLVKSVSVGFYASIGLLLLMGIHFGVQAETGTQSLLIAKQNATFQSEVPPPRGLFYDVNGKRLVSNKNGYYVAVQSSITQEEYIYLSKELFSLGKTVSAYEETQKQGSDRVVLVAGLTADQAVLLQSKLPEIGLEVGTIPIRSYLFPKQMSQILGYTGPVSEEDINNGYGYQDRVGKQGLESVLEERLKGIKGKEVSLGLTREIYSALPGENIVLTINIDWQRALYKLLGNQVESLGANVGAAAIVDIETGDLAAYASYPSFDSNDFVQGISSEKYTEYVTDPRKPLIDKLIGLQAPPGSTFKLVSAFANLEKGTIDADTRVFSTGCMPLGNREFCEYGKYHLGELDITTALARSSNTFFCEGTLKLVNEYGMEEYQQLANQLGIGVKTGIDLPGELSGIMPSPKYKLDTFGEGWFAGDSCNTSIGQGMVLVTPLQMLMMTSTIANGGKYYKPNLIKEIQDQEGNVIESDFQQLEREVQIDQKTRDFILEGMNGSVSYPNGTAYRVLNGAPGNPKAKTGSAEAVEFVDGEIRSRVHGWVVGTFEYQNRTYAYVVHVHYGGGGWNATPVVRDFLGCLYSNFPRSCR